MGGSRWSDNFYQGARQRTSQGTREHTYPANPDAYVFHIDPAGTVYISCRIYWMSVGTRSPDSLYILREFLPSTFHEVRPGVFQTNPPLVNDSGTHQMLLDIGFHFDSRFSALFKQGDPLAPSWEKTSEVPSPTEPVTLWDRLNQADA